MAKRTWDKGRAASRIASRLAEVETVDIKDYVRDTNLIGLRNGLAYRVNGVHLYIDILNVDEMLNVTEIEGVIAHRRTLRFLNLHYRAVRNILLDVDAIQVDFHNQRLHAVFAKPYGDEAARIHRAIATAQLIIDVLAQTGEDGEDLLPAAKVRAGIDSGEALAVNNGRRGNRESLFLGEPANLAAKRAGGGQATGIYLTNNARSVVGWIEVADVDATALNISQVRAAQDKAKLSFTVEDVLGDWERDLAKNPIGAIEFYRHTPPFQDLDLEVLTPKNARRQESTSIYADIDGFTSYVSARINDDESAKDVVKVLHVLRAELDAVLHSDFAGRKIRFIGDCVHGMLVEGTAQTTDDGETAKNALLCAAALRSSFELALDILGEEAIDVEGLGIQIGLEHGPTAITRLGVKGEMIRCCISRAVLRSEDEQLRCRGDETAIGPVIYDHAPLAFKELFGSFRRRASFDYEVATQALWKDEKARKAAAPAPDVLLRQATTAGAAGFTFPSKAAGPSKTPAGFA
jgi:class 3 adenylate cyclase